MNKFLIILLILWTPYVTEAQKLFTIDDFSKDYYGKIKIDDTGAVFSPGWIGIFDKRSNKELIHIKSDELALTLHEGKAKSNIKQLPYGEQSLIIYEDFNFDGINDLAIEDGQNSCYHGPSFQVYSGSKSGFKPDEAFTQLAQENCGMFQVDKRNKTISTMTKSGCCWHQSSEYKVINGKLQAVKVSTLDQAHFPFTVETTETWNGTKMTTSTSRSIDQDAEGMATVLSFRLAKNNKEVRLFSYEDQLYYVFTGANNTIEFAYPTLAGTEEHPTFYLKEAGGVKILSFTNKDARYEISETTNGADAGKTVLLVTIKGKSYPSEGKKAGKTGSLSTLPGNLTNVVKK